jgi:hypothetical protein
LIGTKASSSASPKELRMGSHKSPFMPAQIRKALLDAHAQGVEIAEVRSHPDGSLSFVAKLAHEQPLEATEEAPRAKAQPPPQRA